MGDNRNACQSKMVMTNSETAKKGGGKPFIKKDRRATIEMEILQPV